ncbi:unnamed protein product [Cuscuta epithymum]|uniref:F-box domain-containing protein n=1 Tax=Cuscuta epithymum TaxID=186058 RepID=A0AAV0EJQ1_9ASTE|nr:unnamed protein product [Cuscuta epithymum]CAH9124102.1 unnamed protein product [Cuscuta epithymum]
MARRDRISQLPEDVLDHILGLLPIQQAAKIAVLSTVWRDLWTTLTQLCFDCHFFEYFNRKYRRASKYVRKSSALYVITKILLQHKGTIRKCVIHLSLSGDLIVRSRSFDFDQWLHLVTFKGVEEFHLRFGRAYKLPNCIFLCSTLKSLHLHGFSIEPLNLPRTFPPNLTSLYLAYVDFGSTNLSNYVVDVPMLENLSFWSCANIPDFKITARKLCSLAINGWYYSQLNKSPRLNLDFKSICTLDLDSSSLQYIVEESATREQLLQPHALNVELLKVSRFCFQRDVVTFAFVSLLCICPKLYKLEISFTYEEDTTKAIDATSNLLKKLCSVVRTYDGLLVLKLCSFRGFRSQMLFIKEMLANLPSLETVLFINDCIYDSNKKHEIMEEVLCFPRASIKAKIVY